MSSSPAPSVTDSYALVRARTSPSRLVTMAYYTAWEDSCPLDPEAPGSAKTLLEQLAWWAGALRTAREANPYPA
ncbi:hypothetical protein ACFWXA_01860 [Streptomyces atroolivaceus]|uniref:hypothetical protein n=1 Tax=Streptomyces atroolivaceus TaxID=66869 RepID=UPI0036534EC2